jgi:uncharacterized membrane protein
MGFEHNNSTQRQQALLLGRLLQVGVILAAVVVLGGGIIYLSKHGGEPVEFKVFRGEPIGLRRADEILRGGLSLQGRAIIQFGLLLLIATPIARVLLSVFTFIRQRDFTYVVITLIVLGLLLFSLLGGGL